MQFYPPQQAEEAQINQPQIIGQRNKSMQGDDSMEDEEDDTQYLNSEVEVSEINGPVVQQPPVLQFNNVQSHLNYQPQEFIPVTGQLISNTQGMGFNSSAAHQVIQQLQMQTDTMTI